jgi:hypothetical protein
MFISGREVLEMLCPEGGWILVGDSYEGITWVDDRPRCTKAEFEAGFAKVEAWKAEQDSAQTQAKAAAEGKLAALGLTTDDLQALGL